MTDLVGRNYEQQAREGDWLPSAHECLKPLEARSLLTDEG